MSEFPKITPLRLLERLRTRVSPSNNVTSEEIHRHTNCIRGLCLRHSIQHRKSCQLLTENVCS